MSTLTSRQQDQAWVPRLKYSGVPGGGVAVPAFEPSFRPVLSVQHCRGTRFPDADVPAQSQINLRVFKQWWCPWTQKLGKHKCCPSMQPVLILTLTLFKRPALGRTTLKIKIADDQATLGLGVQAGQILTPKEAGNVTFSTALTI